MSAPARRCYGDLEFAPPRSVAVGRIAVAVLCLGIAGGGAAK